jgi:hypothetical protein
VTAAAGRGELFAIGSLTGELAVARVPETKPDWTGKLDGSPIRALVLASDGSALLYATEKVIGRLPLTAPPVGKGKAYLTDVGGIGQ